MVEFVPTIVIPIIINIAERPDTSHSIIIGTDIGTQMMY